MQKEKSSTQHHGAHAGFRKGTDEYNDGANIDINGGNDDYPLRNFILDAFSCGTGIPDSDVGVVAYGNKVEEEADTEDEEEAHLMSEDEAVDEALKETFPASDPPGFRSKSKIDQESHRAG